MSEANRRAAEEIVKEAWRVRQRSNVLADAYLVRNIDTAIARAVEGERAKYPKWLERGWLQHDHDCIIVGDECRCGLSAALRAPGEKA